MHKENDPIKCTLCGSKANYFCTLFSEALEYFKCSNCKAVFKTSKDFVDKQAEKKRYLTHNNNVADIAYQKFVSPITDTIVNDFTQDSTGLDYGCGTGPVASYVLEKKGYHTTLYDPFFYPNKDYLLQQYDYIICCEVMEHFFKPKEEFIKLQSLLKPKGKLYCKTSLISNHCSVKEFSKWYYKNDPTHVFFYAPQSLDYICNALGFITYTYDSNLIVFQT